MVRDAAQLRINQAGRANKNAPVQRVDGAHAGDGISYRDLVGCLAQMVASRQVLRCSVQGLRALGDPFEHLNGCILALPKTTQQRHQERVTGWLLSARLLELSEQNG